MATSLGISNGSATPNKTGGKGKLQTAAQIPAAER